MDHESTNELQAEIRRLAALRADCTASAKAIYDELVRRRSAEVDGFIAKIKVAIDG